MNNKNEFVYFGKADEFDQNSSIEYWQNQSPEIRLLAVWELTVEAWKLKGRDPDELRFQRSVALFKRL